MAGGFDYLKRKAEEGNKAAQVDLAKIVPPKSTLIWEAFQFLSRSRSVGFGGAEAIRVSEIAAYCDFHGIGDPGQRSRLINGIQKLDAEFLEWTRQKE